MSLPSLQPFVRDRLTWLAYAMLAYVGFSQSILGPLMPFLRTELHLNYTLGGFLPASLAMGLILSGLFGDWLARHQSRGVVFWMGAIGLGTSVVLLGLSHQFELALIAVLGMGFSSSLTQVMLQALLADHHAERRSIAITEANVAASLSTTLTPLVIASLQVSGVGWRTIPIPVILFCTLLAIRFYRQSIPDGPAPRIQSGSDRGSLPISFWLYWMVLFFVVAVEMSMVVWATDFLDTVAGLSRTDAVLGYSAFPAAMLLGRIAGSRLTRRWASLSLLLMALGLTLGGFLFFWLGQFAALNIIGLFVTGLGIANLYPLTLSIAIGLAADQSNTASARVSLGVGTALLTAPLLLGWLADRLSLQDAYGMVIVLMVAACAIVINNHWLSERKVVFPR
ncbi:MAG TPA: MFS transporter [Anaerolineales bacterium]|nr:MFS transporter [Anaerolineales bacterium]